MGKSNIINSLPVGGEVLTSEISTAGQDWAVDDWFYVDSGSGDFWGYVTEIGAGGSVVSYVMDSGGSGYTVSNGVSCVADGGSGTGLTLNILTATEIILSSNLSKSSGAVVCDYLNISNLNATGGAVWYAGRNSIDTTNNNGWIFDHQPNAVSFGDNF